MHTVMHVSVKMCDACQLLWLDVSFNELEELNLEELLCCPVRSIIALMSSLWLRSLVT